MGFSRVFPRSPKKRHLAQKCLGSWAGFFPIWPGSKTRERTLNGGAPTALTFFVCCSILWLWKSSHQDTRCVVEVKKTVAYCPARADGRRVCKALAGNSSRRGWYISHFRTFSGLFPLPGFCIRRGTSSKTERSEPSVAAERLTVFVKSFFFTILR